jgi:8-oxo-dGTP pyrophosphatase MutT (NUDIX family)
MMIKQLPISITPACKSDMRSQFAALCYRIVKGKPEVLLVTSRRTGRWIVPKGWPMPGRTPAASAAGEAWEEAGVVGKAVDQCLGLFSYQKEHDGGWLPCVALVYPVEVKSLARRFPERGQRRRKWLSPKKAAARVSEPELARILLDFDPGRLA